MACHNRIKTLDKYGLTRQTILYFVEEAMYTIKEDGPYWQLQKAKAMFSKVVRSANHEPQIITVHGRETAVVISMESYRKLSAQKESLVNFMEQSPLASLELELPKRQFTKMRDIGL